MESNLYEKYEACMVLSGVGDAMGYKNGAWEFDYNGRNIHKEMMKITENKGPLALNINNDWKYSDDTVMHIATAKALEKVTKETTIDEIGKYLAAEYVACWVHMKGRAPGPTTRNAVESLTTDG